jgi:glycosyltransferase involved in cell wall biosynthesis
MAAGVPVVATAVGGTPEMVDDGVTGLLVPVRDAAALGEAISSLLADPARRAAIGEAGRRRVEEHFSLEAMVRATEQLYERLLAEADEVPAQRGARPLREKECP